MLALFLTKHAPKRIAPACGLGPVDQIAATHLVGQRPGDDAAQLTHDVGEVVLATLLVGIECLKAFTQLNRVFGGLAWLRGLATNDFALPQIVCRSSLLPELVPR